MILRNARSVSAPHGVRPAPFDAEFRRSVRDFLDRDICWRRGIGPSRLGRLAVGNPGFVRECIVLGADVQIDTADAVRILIGETPFRPRFCRELELFMELTGANPWVIGWRSVQNKSFVKRLEGGSTPYLRTVDRVRTWMYGQLRGWQRRAVFGTEPGMLPFGPIPGACQAPFLGRDARTFEWQ
ncbi:MAG: hypothetical protein OXQ89_05190 [Rhodospirillaceae bacterium]|nr:hypothetical protein [Rhodospirillaceae bacterium]MDE0363021.1 hypothetical protein [Rhodospirillaceae bacterium]